MIRLQNITLALGPRVLLDKVNWTIYDRQRIGIIGANGSGKTTLFALLQQAIPPDNGDLDIPKRLKMATVAQELQGSAQSAIDFVLDGDDELRTLEHQLRIAEQQDDGTRIAELHEKLGAIDAYSAPARAAALLDGLGFAYNDQNKSVAAFSGGWRVRLNLAKALMTRSDMLLLDEPTNHLDLDAILWLEQWLKNYPGTLLIISHDRDFLDSTVDHIVYLHQQQLKLYTGNYSTFETLRASELLLQQAVYEKQQRQLAHLQSFVERFRYKATKAKQAQSRLKAIERMELVSAVQSETAFQFEFAEPEQTPHTLVSLNDASIAYNERNILSNINLTIAAKERIAILGPNGAGKSSLIKLLAQEMPPSTGTYETANGLKIGYFAQHQVDHLNLHESPLEHIKNHAGNTQELVLRKFLGGFDFSGDRVFEPIQHFSGGEKSRLALALLVFQKPNLLLLDEPTNHLDLEMRNALSFALQAYTGAMVLVSHDRYLVRSTTDQLWLAADGTLQPFDGDLDDYQQWLFAYRRKQENFTAAPTTLSKKQQRKQSAQEREQQRPLQDKIKHLETELSKLQQQEKQLEVALTDQSLYEVANKTKLQEQLLALSEIKKSLEATEQAWLEACAEAEQ